MLIMTLSVHWKVGKYLDLGLITGAASKCYLSQI